VIYGCTYCSREKSGASGNIPAKERYSSKRVQAVVALCSQRNIPLLFLSGKYGLIKSEEKIPFYNQRLVDELVPQISEMAIKQAEELKISELIFFAKQNDDKLKPYFDVIQTVCEKLGIKLTFEILSE